MDNPLPLTVKASRGGSEDVISLNDMISISPSITDQMNEKPTYLNLRDIALKGIEELHELTSKSVEYSWLNV